jgi:predicted DNA-binding protein
MASVTIDLSEQLHQELKSLSEQQQRPLDEFVRECLRRYAAAVRFRSLRNQVLPFAEAQGVLTDEDVFGAIS